MAHLSAFPVRCIFCATLLSSAAAAFPPMQALQAGAQQRAAATPSAQSLLASREVALRLSAQDDSDLCLQAWVSADTGQTWQPVAAQVNGNNTELQLTLPSDGQFLVALASEND